MWSEMKRFLLMTTVVMLVGCGKREQPVHPEGGSSTNSKPVVGLTLKEKVVGSYDGKVGKNNIKFVLLENGKVESYLNGEKIGRGKWKLAGNEVHFEYENRDVSFLRIGNNGDLNGIAMLKGGKREALPKDKQFTYKKVK